MARFKLAPAKKCFLNARMKFRTFEILKAVQEVDCLLVVKRNNEVRDLFADNSELSH
jgi:hypothetical protein